MNLKGLLYLLLLDWKMKQISLLESFWMEVFYFPSDFIVLAENF